MPKIFISYRRKSWPFTHRLADELGQRLDAEIFVDFSGIDEADFERAILRHLRDRIHRDDDWVRREIREALLTHKPLIMVCVEGLLPPTGLPDDIKDVARMQGINFYPEYFSAAIERLAEFVIKVGAAHPRTITIPAASPVNDEKSIGGRATLDEALDLLQAGDFRKAIFLLESLTQTGYHARYVNIADVLAQARQEAAQIERRRQAALDYDEILAFARRTVTEDHARSAFVIWCQDYPELVADLDTENLRERLKSARRSHSRVYDLLPPPFAWIEIPAGKVTVEKFGEANVPAFSIAKYPLTNAQYEKFIEAGGYRYERWWTAAGWRAREKGDWTEPRSWQENKWNGAEQPVVGVSWYESLAFCRWLSAASGEEIMLPTEQQWQRAAQGDDGRIYPWGNEWDGDLCNNSVKPHDSNQTTPVRQYEGKGDSPFGVVDMAGNVWEWCLTAYQSGSTSPDGTDRRVLRGGSFDDTTINLCAANRYFRSPDVGNDYFGIRCVRSR
jgi:hypothetical protein